MHRDYFSVEMMLKSDSFWEKASGERRRLHGVQAARLLQVTNAVVIEAQVSGDLPKDIRPMDVTLSLIAVTMGSHIAAMQPDLQVACAIEDPICVVRMNQDRMCDGWGWKPLLAEWDYAATDRRIRAEVFPEATWFKAG